ncbi:5-(carboxyamino)imidazole ribonucleotide mutase [Pseudothermotoga sp.]|uniref:5-(carboxyamino)imidazole ribonucleotide mutase n=1 Tax=Pseudothermotoga sp. TaxID=2033661 RepID=UPI0031F720A1
MLKVAIVVGSSSDLAHAERAGKLLEEFEVPHEIFVLSAHRTPFETLSFAQNAEKNGFSVIIAMAGKAAHLPGVIAANTTLPVIGVPLAVSLNGLDSLLSIVQMPSGVPVACMGIDGAVNAALFAVAMLSLKDEKLSQRLKDYREKMKQEVLNWKRG